MKDGVLSLLLLALAGACTTDNGTKIKAAPQEQSAPSHLPVSDLLREDLRKAEIYAGGILKKTVVAGKKDSAFIDLPALQKEASRFFRPELDSAFFNSNYTESSLMDETTGLINFIYTAKDEKIALQKVIVYIKPDPGTDKLDRVILEIRERKEDRYATIKMNWKCKAYFIIAESKTGDAKPEVRNLEKIIWDPEKFSAD